MPDRPPVLVPIRVLEGDSLPDGVPELLANAHVVLLGYHAIPEQTAPGQARMQFEERAVARLDNLEAMLEAAGATVERRLVFTHEPQKTIDRMIYEHGCLAVLVPDAVGPVEDVLIPVRGTVSQDRLVAVAAGLFADTDAAVTLYHIASEGESDEDAQSLLEELGSRLVAAGIDRERVTTWIAREAAPVESIIEASADFDAVVMGETDPSIATFVFGLPAAQVAEQFLGPVFVVQRERPESEE